MNIKNCRAVAVNIERDVCRDERYPYSRTAIRENGPPRVEVTISLPIRPEDLPAFLADRRINIEIEATPGESAYLEYCRTNPNPPSVFGRCPEWDKLSPQEKDRWESIAREAKRAH